MDSEGYPEKEELAKIKNWKPEDFIQLVDYIQERWTYEDYFIKKWGKEYIHHQSVMLLELHTAGWSGNESIIDALMCNDMFKMFWYTKWERGGHYCFEINPFNVGYKSVKEYCKDTDVTRQYIYKIKDRFDWIVISKNVRLMRPKEKLTVVT